MNNKIIKKLLNQADFSSEELNYPDFDPQIVSAEEIEHRTKLLFEKIRNQACTKQLSDEEVTACVQLVIHALLFFHLAGQGYVDTCRDLMSNHGVNPKWRDAEALSLASAHGHLDMVRFLSKECGMTPTLADLTRSYRGGHLEVLKCLLPLVPPLDLRKISYWFATTIQFACAHGNLPLLEIVFPLAIKHDPNFCHAAEIAAAHGQIAMVQWLLKHVAVQELSTNGQMGRYALYGLKELALEQAAESGHLAIVEYLLKQGANSYYKMNTALCKASKNGHLDIVKLLHQWRSNPAAQNNLSLQEASANGHLDVVHYLLALPPEDGIDVTANNNCAIHLACISGHIAIVRCLQERGAVFSRPNNTLALACQNGCLNTVQYLMSLRLPDLDPTHGENVAFIFACGSGNLQLVQYLLSLRPEFAIDPTTKFNQAFSEACESGNLDLVRYLISLRPEFNIDPTANDNQAFQTACQWDRHEVIQYLLSLKPDFDIDPARDENNALKTALIQEQPDDPNAVSTLSILCRHYANTFIEKFELKDSIFCAPTPMERIELNKRLLEKKITAHRYAQTLHTKTILQLLEFTLQTLRYNEETLRYKAAQRSSVLSAFHQLEYTAEDASSHAKSIAVLFSYDGVRRKDVPLSQQAIIEDPEEPKAPIIVPYSKKRVQQNF